MRLVPELMFPTLAYVYALRDLSSVLGGRLSMRLQIAMACRPAPRYPPSQTRCLMRKSQPNGLRLCFLVGIRTVSSENWTQGSRCRTAFGTVTPERRSFYQKAAWAGFGWDGGPRRTCRCQPAPHFRWDSRLNVTLHWKHQVSRLKTSLIRDTYVPFTPLRSSLALLLQHEPVSRYSSDIPNPFATFWEMQI